MAKAAPQTPALVRINARAFLNYSIDELWQRLQGEFYIVFADGEMLANERDVIYSRYVWEMIVKYPKTVLMKKHFVRHLIGEGDMPTNTTIKLVEKVLFSIYDTYCEEYLAQGVSNAQFLDDLAKLAYETINHIYNEMSYRCSEYVTSLDIVDFVKINQDPGLREMIATMQDTETNIARVKEKVEELIYRDANYRDNPLAIAIRIGAARSGQAIQCLGIRGMLTDLNGLRFLNPVKRGFVDGLRSLYDSMVESRSSAKALANAEKPLQDSETFSRRQQLICMNLRHLHEGDCGSKEYLHWHVRGKEVIDGRTMRESDLKTIEGKYYFDEETKSLKMIHASDNHLIGKTLLIRSFVAGCMHPDPYGVCTTCFGGFSTAIPPQSNLGHLGCVVVASQISQSILSTKHIENSVQIEPVVLTALGRKYLETDKEGTIYYLNKRLAGKKIVLSVTIQDLQGLSDVQMTNNTLDLNPMRVSSFGTVWFRVGEDSETPFTDPIVVGTRDRPASMSHELLRYLKQKGITQNNTAYKIDLTNWDFGKPLFMLPMAQFNVSAHRSEIAKLLESTAKDLTRRSTVVRPTAMLIELHDLVNKRLQINLALLEAILYPSMVVSAVENNYDLPKPWTNNGIGVMQQLLLNRSLGAQMAYQKHHLVFSDPMSFLEKKRMDHINDGIVMPELLNTLFAGSRNT